jgi:hypothetical protein
MPNTPGTIIDHKEVSYRAVIAGLIIGQCFSDFPSLASRWQPVSESLADIPVLVSQACGLAGSLASQRRRQGNLAAAAKASLAACDDQDHDPLGYLRDELAAQGYLPPQDRP